MSPPRKTICVALYTKEKVAIQLPVSEEENPAEKKTPHANGHGTWECLGDVDGMAVPTWRGPSERRQPVGFALPERVPC